MDHAPGSCRRSRDARAAELTTAYGAGGERRAEDRTEPGDLDEGGDEEGSWVVELNRRLRPRAVVPIQLPVYRRTAASKKAFIEFWAAQVSARDLEQDQKLYTAHIDKPLSAQTLHALYQWKNQMRLSDAKRRSVQKKYVSLLPALRRLPQNTDPQAFLRRFAHGGAIWGIFLLHCWSRSRYPIYDQHVHRAMTFIRGERREEISGWGHDRKIKAYVERYEPFYRTFDDLHPRTIDRALWVFGRFLKTSRFPDVVAEEYGLPCDDDEP
jgi:hypothetical protein